MNNVSLHNGHAVGGKILPQFDSLVTHLAQETIQMGHCSAGLVVEDDQAPWVRPVVRHGVLQPPVRVTPVARHAVPQDAGILSGLKRFDHRRVQQMTPQPSGPRAAI